MFYSDAYVLGNCIRIVPLFEHADRPEIVPR